MRWSQCTVLGTAGRGFAGLHELQQRHLGGGVLHGHPVRGEINVGDAALIGFAGLVAIQVAVEDFLRQGKRPAHGGAGSFDAGTHAVVHGAYHFEVKGHSQKKGF
jgi:hypothetical protein